MREEENSAGTVPGAAMADFYIILKLYPDKNDTMIGLIVHYIKPSGCCHGPNGVTTTPGPPDEPVTAWPKPGAWVRYPAVL